ncbi:hypothetical protein ABPG77_000272 [Micractinium sp. CCAP 211/92]
MVCAHAYAALFLPPTRPLSPTGNRAKGATKHGSENRAIGALRRGSDLRTALAPGRGAERLGSPLWFIVEAGKASGRDSVIRRSGRGSGGGDSSGGGGAGGGKDGSDSGSGGSSGGGGSGGRGGPLSSPGRTQEQAPPAATQTAAVVGSTRWVYSMSPYAFVVAAITLGGFWVASSYILISQTKAVEGESDKRLAEMVWQLKARSAEEQRRWEKRMQSATASFTSLSRRLSSSRLTAWISGRREAAIPPHRRA